MLNLQQVPLSWAKRQAEGAIAGGLALERLFDRALISPRLDDERDRISPLQLLVFYAALVLETDDCTHSMLHDRLEPVIGPLGLRVLFSSATLGDGLKALARFYEISSRSIRLKLSTDGDAAFLALQVEDDRGRGRDQEDIQLTYHYLGLTSYLGRAFPVTWVGTRDPEHFNLGFAHYVIGGPVVFHRQTGISFPKALLATKGSSSKAADFNWRPVGDALELLCAPELGSGPNNKDLRLHPTAALHMMAPSTYRRVLSQNGTGFRRMRDQALLDRTLDLLKCGEFSLDAIAAELGYADARNLRRFVKRTTGQTPREIREGFIGSTPPSKLRGRLQDIMALMNL